MSAGSRRDMLNDITGDMNYGKLKTMGSILSFLKFAKPGTYLHIPAKLLVAKLNTARSASSNHRVIFEELSSSIQPALLSEWHAMVDAFHVL
jgi:hypothetical protein